jgi:Vault protein inter-alpha-trypsin domain
MSPFLALCALLASPLAMAQDDRSAGLYSEARQLPLVSQSLTVDIDGDEAIVSLTQVFANPQGVVGQADCQLPLPEGASVDGFGFWVGDRYLEAKLERSEQARANHDAAASEHRATGLLQAEGRMQRFSVYPVEAGRSQQVEVRLRLQVEVEGGRRELRLPIDAFLGQAAPTSSVLVRLRSDRPLQGVGLSAESGGAVEVTELRRSADARMLATSARQPLVLHWEEESPPIDLVALRAETPDGGALALRVGLNRMEGDTSWRQVTLIVDDSHSMRRRQETVAQVVARVEGVGLPVKVRRVEGHSLGWPALAKAAVAEGCGPAVRCLILTDAQLSGIAAAEGAPVELLVLADAMEQEHFIGKLPPRAVLFQPGVDSEGRLRGLVDQLSRPVLEIERLRIGQQDVLPLASGPLRVAEGGLLRVHALGVAGDELLVEGTLAGTPFRRVVPIQSAGAAEARVRRAAYRDQLATWMRSWKSQPDAALQARIEALSLREGIPTAFTSLQVDDPELSLVAMKPGDPILRVDGAAGVVEVDAWYPFGISRRLRHEDGGYSDRFLVPRAWEDRAYRIETFSRQSDGGIIAGHAWYVLDDQAPDAVIRTEGGLLVVDTGAGTPDVSRVELEAEGLLLPLSLDESGPWSTPTRWTASLADLPAAFELRVRDRAGNVLQAAATVEDGELVVSAQPPAPRSAPVLEALDGRSSLQVEEGGARLDHGQVTLDLVGRTVRFPAAGLGLRSLVPTAAADLGDRLLLGTRGGDLLELRCAGDDCAVQRIETGAPEHPVTGIVRLPDGRVLVGVLGVGLQLVKGDRLVAAPWKVGSQFVTGVQRAANGDILVGTAYNGLWRLRGGKMVQERFAGDHVAGLRGPAALLPAQLAAVDTVDGGGLSFLRRAPDRFVETVDANRNEGRAADLMDLVSFESKVYAAGFDRGLLEVGAHGEVRPVALDLSVYESRINRLAVRDGALYLGTEGGLLRVDPVGGRVERLLPSAVHDLADGAEGLAVAASDGLFLVASDGISRLDRRGPELVASLGTGRYTAVTWHAGALWVGAVDGLYRVNDGALTAVGAASGYRGGWVTDLEVAGGELYVGTYADGVWHEDDGALAIVAGLEGQWVPPAGLSMVEGLLWVGGLGMPAVRLDPASGQAQLLALPVRDVNRAAAVSGETWLATSDGLVRLVDPALAAR